MYPAYTDPKPASQSVTVRGALVAALATVLSAALSFAGLDVPHALLFEALTHGAALAGAAVAIYGRVKARRPIA